MKKLILAIALIGGLSGCASSSRVAELEQKVDAIGVYTANNGLKVEMAVINAKHANEVAEQAKVEASAAVEAVNRMAEKCCRK